MASIESIVTVIRRKGAVDSQPFWSELQSIDDEVTRERFACDIISMVCESSPLDADAIKRCLNRAGHDFLVTDYPTDWFDKFEGNDIVKTTKTNLALPYPTKGITAPFAIKVVNNNRLNEDLSFLVKRGRSTLLCARCTALGLEICNSGWPVSFIHGTDNLQLLHSAMKTAIRHLILLRRIHCAPRIRLLMDEITSTACDQLSIHFDREGDYVNMYVDLTLSETLIWTHIRKSYKSLINKYRHRKPVVSLSFDPSDGIFLRDKYIDTTLMEYQNSMMSVGQGCLLKFGDDDRTRVAITGIVDVPTTSDARVAYYNIGAYDKTNPCHYALYQTIQYLCDQKYGRFYIGVGARYRSADTKLGTIQFFKQGFATDIERYKVAETSMS
jgi:hypothetical protein